MGKISEEVETVGRRVARLRKERGITQTELAESLGVTQPLVSEWERDQLRLHGDLIIELARIFAVSADEILGVEPSQPAPGTPTRRRLSRRLRDIERLPKRDQDALLRTIDAFLAKAG